MSWGSNWDRGIAPLKRMEQVVNSFQESLTGGVISIAAEQTYTHLGHFYDTIISFGNFNVIDGGYYVISTPEDKDIHLTNFTLQAIAGTVKATLKRSTTANPIVFTETEGALNIGTTNNTIIGPHNKNDVINIPSGSTVTANPTFDTEQNGEDWKIIEVFGDTTNQYTSINTIEFGTNEKYILKANSYYLIYLEDIDDSATDIWVKLTWCEEPTMATLLDIEELKKENPEFYENAKEGDFLVIYSEKAIIFRETENKIINVAPVYFEQTEENTNTDPSGTSLETDEITNDTGSEEGNISEENSGN